MTHESAAFPVTAVDVVDTAAPRRAGFAHGILAGIAIAAVLVHVWLAIELSSFERMYEDFGGPVQAATRFVLSRGWLVGVPVAGGAAIAVLVVRRPRTLVLYAVLAAALVATVIATNYLSTAPIGELGANIKAE